MLSSGCKEFYKAQSLIYSIYFNGPARQDTRAHLQRPISFKAPLPSFDVYLTDAFECLQRSCKPAALGSPTLGSPRFGSPRGLQSHSFSYSMERRYSESNSSTPDEMSTLRAENRDLSAQASKAVEMNVEITSLKNQVSFSFLVAARMWGLY